MAHGKLVFMIIICVTVFIVVVMVTDNFGGLGTFYWVWSDHVTDHVTDHVSNHVTEHVSEVKKAKHGHKKTFLNDSIDDEILDLTMSDSALSLSGRSSPHQHIAFIKVPKAASSTLQTIFQSYSWRRPPGEVNLVLRPHGVGLGYPKLFTGRYILPAPGGHHDIICNHARYSPAMKRFMPSDTVYVTVIREPVGHFESSYQYFNLTAKLGTTMEQFLETTGKMAAHRDGPGRRVYRKWSRLSDSVSLRNLQTFDLSGVARDPFHKDHLRPSVTARRLISMLNSHFSLVMIVDLLDESLILLRHVLGWTVGDMVAFHRKNRLSKYRPLDTAARDKKERLAAITRRWNAIDVIVYNYFRVKLLRHIVWYGEERMAWEVARLREVREQTYRDCVNVNTTRAPRRHQRVVRYELREDRVHNKTCQVLCWNNGVVTDKIRHRQWPNRFP